MSQKPQRHSRRPSQTVFSFPESFSVSSGDVDEKSVEVSASKPPLAEAPPPLPVNAPPRIAVPIPIQKPREEKSDL
ncbi:hypothetical protein AMTR_s00012p00092910 [Amborella trichopoda]|uniref:Uncharacterized protein n=1 Tax=Amborella trichopoda TaxID=13333 RepID=W1PID9_AMBTC|nr:hypothetical protein AMTR_s00012p00092910 [Amborella trichopoda]